MKKTFLLTMILAATGANTAVHAHSDGFRHAAPKPVIHLEQGWTEAERDSFYYDTVGSRWMPYSWFLALEQADSPRLFRSRHNMAQYGAYFGNPSPKNPDNLPIGFARVEADGQDWMGPNCASCHVTELTYEGKKIHIDGGAGLADQYTMVKDFSTALTATLDNRRKFRRFAFRVLFSEGTPISRENINALRDQMTEVAAVLDHNADGSGAGSGPGRNDSFQFILNNTNCDILGVAENCLPAEDKPLRFAPIWEATKLEWDHHNSQAYNPVLRSFIAQAGYPFGSFDGQTFNVNVDAVAIHDVLALLRELKAPAWDEEIFGEIDHASAERGSEIYEAKCAACHTTAPYPMTEPNEYGAQFIESTMVPIDLTGMSASSVNNIGTDPNTLLPYFFQVQQPGPLAPFIPPEYLLPDGTTPAAVLFNVIILTALQQNIAPLNMTPEETLEFFFYTDFRTASLEQLATVRARLPEGMLWKGNFLHNGSIANVYELLLPQEERSETFIVGDHEFDPVNLGFAGRPGQPQEFLLDTSVTGNSNQGHSGPDYGTDMSDQDRMDVIEYLKTL